jgi:putative restriction endonuclease
MNIRHSDRHLSELSERLATLPIQHRQALEWFWDRRGMSIGNPEPINGIHVVNPQTGIQKPAGWKYAVSVRQTLGSQYGDHPPQSLPNGSWTYDYVQERKDPDQAAKVPTNRALFDCRDDGVPVAVLIQEQAKPRAIYKVLGLAVVVGFDKGYFRLKGYDHSGTLYLSDSQSTKDIYYPISAGDHGSLAEPGQPLDVADARKRIEAQIVVRQGGKVFRKEALKNFKGRCAISGWDVEAVLEAAHIVPHRGPHTDQADNALLLRADLHTLFDRELLNIDPETRRIQLAPALEKGPYAAFAGQQVRLGEGVTPETFRDRLHQRGDQLKSKMI